MGGQQNKGIIEPTEKWFTHGEQMTERFLSGYANHQNWENLEDCNLVLRWASGSFCCAKGWPKNHLHGESFKNCHGTLSISWFYLALFLKSGRNWAACRLEPGTMQLLSKYLKSHFVRTGSRPENQLSATFGLPIWKTRKLKLRKLGDSMVAWYKGLSTRRCNLKGFVGLHLIAENSEQLSEVNCFP